MRNINSIIYWENKRRIKKLDSFREDVRKYYSNSTFNFLDGRNENQTAVQLRTKINEQLLSIESIVMKSGLPLMATHYPPPALGGFVKNINLIHNILTLSEHQIDYNVALDMIEISSGSYKDNIQSSILRTINPFYYLKELLMIVSEWLVSPLKPFLPNRFSNIIKNFLYILENIVVIYTLYLWWGKDIVVFVKHLLIFSK